MRRTLFLIAILNFVLLLASSVLSKDTRYVEIKKPFATVYKYLDPKSEIITQTSKNQHIELIYEGTSWYQVKVNNKIGWLEKSAGIVVDNPGKTIMSIPVGTFVFFIILLVATIAVTTMLIYKQKNAEI